MCSRLQHCPKCGEAVQDLEEHTREAHKQVQCPECQELVDEYFFSNHQTETCPRRVVGKCPYCEIDLLACDKDGLFMVHLLS